jgi:hypothetical protein
MRFGWGWTLLVLAAALTAVGAGETFSPLFVIERSINKNVVHYDAHLRPDGSIDLDQPLIAYWILEEKGGRRQDLNLLERTRAYGFKFAARGKSVEVTLAADRTHPILIYSTPQGVRAETKIDGHRSYLRKIFVTTRRTMLLDLPERAELFGEDVATGEPRSEVVYAKL